MLGPEVPLHWPLLPSILIGVAILTTAYLAALTRWRGHFPRSAPVPKTRAAAFLLAMATILVALQTPIADLSDNYLFSAHMVEHLLVTLVMPPLLLAGLPGWLVRPLVASSPGLRRAGRILTHPLVAFGLFNGIFVIYHAPVFYNSTLGSQYVHAFAHLIFMLTAFLAWWPVLSPLAELPPLTPPLQLPYLFAQTLPSQALGAYFTFADRPVYPLYAEAPRVWRAITPPIDRQLGGLIMWVLGGTYFLGAFAIVFLRWVAAGEARERRNRRAGRAG